MATKVEYKTRTVSPTQAKKWLAANPHNRNINPVRVGILAEEMRNGHWDLNGEAIKLNGDGSLIDGQHRLAAVIESGVPIKTLVITGLPKNVAQTIDTGQRRSFAQTLTMRGEADSNVLGALVKMQWQLDHGWISHASTPTMPTRAGIDVLAAHDGLRSAVKVGSRANRAIKVPPSLAGFCWYRFSRIDNEHAAEDADGFLEGLVIGESLPSGDPVLELRSRIISNAMSATKYDRVTLHAFFIKAWNAYRTGRELKQLKFRVGGSNPESFPEPI